MHQSRRRPKQSLKQSAIGDTTSQADISLSQSVAYMFDDKQRGKIKNDKIMRWRTELSCYSFDIAYRPGAENVPPDTLSRAFCTAIPPTGTLGELLSSRGYPYVSLCENPQLTLFCRRCATDDQGLPGVCRAQTSVSCTSPSSLDQGHSTF